jgi:D-sedoheptulose 7-phosphate isomerase
MTSPTELGETYLGRVLEALQSIPMDRVTALVDLLLNARESGHTVLVVGNGGSAATASHMATDLGVGSQRFGCGIRTVSLVDNSAVVTATGNDIGFHDVYAAQVRLLGQPGDILVAISASGDSPNLLQAASEAKRQGLTVVAITGFTGGKLSGMADLSIHVQTAQGDYGPAEDVHLVINHMVTELLRLRVGAAGMSRSLHG